MTAGWLSRLVSRRGGERGELDRRVIDKLAAWKSLPAGRLDLPAFDARYVVVNTEASGLDLERDRLLAVGALAIESGVISPQQAWYATLQHAPEAALADLLTFIGNSPVVVFNAPFNRRMLLRAFDETVGFEPDLFWLDLYYLLPALFPERRRDPVRLADWMESFDIETFQRHHGLGDGWAIAQLFLTVQARATGRGAATARGLGDVEHAYREFRRKS
ncbi:3'-5' exonuclease [Thauera phenolivorans]|uniref:3'-5' exonuclease n=1 Tax=Thauera phenolivorans TaxID=1792543 RepID=UPI00083A9D1D|nr:3'-5' exonuclease [Thauera phenolivorans]